jgi:ABC-type branched-subunit amino acid transport system permease subunit
VLSSAPAELAREGPVDEAAEFVPLGGPDRWSLAWARLYGPGVVVVAAVSAAWLIGSDSRYYASLGVRFCVFLLAAMGANLLFGYGGYVVAAYGALLGVAAYAFAIAVNAGVPPPLAGAVGIAATVVSCGLLALPALRLSGIYLAVATLSFQFGMSGVFEGWSDVTGGIQGLKIEELRRASLFGLDGDDQWIAAVVAITAVVLLAWTRLVRGSVGRSIVALREAPLATRCVGARPTVWTLVTFVVAGIPLGLAGVLLAADSAFVSAPSFDLNTTLLILLSVIVGGLGRVGGSVIAALVSVVFVESLATSEYSPVYFSGGVLLALLVLPRGVVHLPEQLSSWARTARELVRQRTRTSAPGS